MPARLTLNEYVVLCGHTESVTALWHHALDFLHDRGIEMVSYHSDDAQTPGSVPLRVVDDGWPKAWVDAQMEKTLHLVDPIPDLAARLARPFLWSEAKEIFDLTPKQAEYLAWLASSGLGDGLAMQVFGPKMRNAYVGMGFGTDTPDIDGSRIFELQCAAQIAHIRYCELTETRQQAVVPLSPREVEILRWIARGKSNSVIGEILGISRHTVDTITRRMFEKLDVNDRTTAAIRGLGSGLLRVNSGDIV